jgi:hypothetical protein
MGVTCGFGLSRPLLSFSESHCRLNNLNPDPIARGLAQAPVSSKNLDRASTRFGWSKSWGIGNRRPLAVRCLRPGARRRTDYCECRHSKRNYSGHTLVTHTSASGVGGDTAHKFSAETIVRSPKQLEHSPGSHSSNMETQILSCLLTSRCGSWHLYPIAMCY